MSQMSKKRISIKASIIEAAFADFTRNPGASLATIAKTAGVGRATLHRHYRTRNDLIHALAVQAASELDEAVLQATKDVQSHIQALQNIMAAVIALGDRQWFLAHEDLSQFRDIEQRNARQNREFRNLVVAAGREGLFRAHCPAEWVMSAYDHLVYAGWMMVRDGHVTSRQAAALAWKTFCDGIGKAEF